MKLGFATVHVPDEGAVTAFVRDGEVRLLDVLTRETVYGLVTDGRINDPAFAMMLDKQPTDRSRTFDLRAILETGASTSGPYFRLPFTPPEMWGVGVSYRKAADLHEEDIEARGGTTGIYRYVFQSRRPEIFFKGLARHCVGHHDAIGIRSDSSGTMIEAELVCVFGSRGIVAYMIGNDITAWDLEKECPLFLTYAKVFTASAALGPIVVPAHAIENPLNLSVTCRIHRQSRATHSAVGHTSNMARSLDELESYLCLHNAVPPGTVLFTGTAVGIPNSLILEPGDLVSIEFEQLGELTNRAVRLVPKTS